MLITLLSIAGFVAIFCLFYWLAGITEPKPIAKPFVGANEAYDPTLRGEWVDGVFVVDEECDWR